MILKVISKFRVVHVYILYSYSLAVSVTVWNVEICVKGTISDVHRGSIAYEPAEGF